MDIYELFIQTLINGILIGAIYAAMTLGFSVIWGVMGVINLAHGEFLMVGAYLTWVLNKTYGWEPFLTLIVVMPVMFLFGYVIQRVLINRIIEKPMLISLLVTYALATPGLRSLPSQDFGRWEMWSCRSLKRWY